MKTIASWIDTWPSPLRHALITLAVTELLVAANAFAGVTNWADVKEAAGGVAVALIVGLARWLQQALSSSEEMVP